MEDGWTDGRTVLGNEKPRGAGVRNLQGPKQKENTEKERYDRQSDLGWAA